MAGAGRGRKDVPSGAAIPIDYEPDRDLMCLRDRTAETVG